MTALAGSCLCGACKFTATPEDGTSHACHCGACRQWSGGMFIAVGCGTSVVFEPEAMPATYQSSAYAERVFCPKCGSSLIWQFQGGTHQQVAIQAFEDPGQFKLTGQVYIDHKPDNYALANETKTMTEAEINAQSQGAEQ